MNLSSTQMVDLYKMMVTIRLFEEKTQDLYARGSIRIISI
jgi:TPP-dependent pyruvate/acetoin dehydrogenase alpha subunit